MKSQTSSGYLPWLIAGIAFLGLLLTVGWHFHEGGNPAEQLASKATRADLVGRMQLDLASAAEAEKSAVLAITDEDSMVFANQARAATGAVGNELRELGRLLSTGGTPEERDLLGQFAASFDNLQRVDDEVLALAVRNTNLKAYSLLFGPAAKTLAEMDEALDRLVTSHTGGPDGQQMMSWAFRARLGVLRIQALLAPHIAEENNAKMDQMEATMTREETQIHRGLDGLATLTKLAGDADLAVASSRFAQYEQIKGEILPLSRENSNVRSLALSRNEKRRAMVMCLDALNTLRQAILDEPIPGVRYGRPAKPR